MKDFYEEQIRQLTRLIMALLPAGEEKRIDMNRYNSFGPRHRIATMMDVDNRQLRVWVEEG